MSEWITDRLPDGSEITNEGDVWVYDIDADEYYIRNCEELVLGQPWMEIPPPPTYVKPTRFEVRETYKGDGFVVIDAEKFSTAIPVPTREAANEIMTIYKRIYEQTANTLTKESINNTDTIISKEEFEVLQQKYKQGDKVIYIPENKVYDFGYIGATGLAIIYEEGEMNGQDSYAVDFKSIEPVTHGAAEIAKFKEVNS